LGLANLIQDDDLVRRTTWMNAFLFFISIFNPIIFFSSFIPFLSFSWYSY
jgi:nucleoside permease NupC